MIPLMHPFIAYDIPSLVAEQARARADHPFLIWHPFDDRPRTWTYRAFARDVDRIAAGLLARGINAGDWVLIHLDNCRRAELFCRACGGSLRGPASPCRSDGFGRDSIHIRYHVPTQGLGVDAC
jgi:acyl-CoA synthetase (AMP-forming)/AMP-acid ligase II